MPGAQTSTSKRNASESQPLEDSVTVSIPCWRCRPYVRQAVDSILQQTHRNLTLILVNDGDEDPPWDLVADIDDPRLVRFDLDANRGRYFVDAVVLEATRAPFFMIQDADDWSEPDRIARLLDALLAQNADAALSCQLRYEADEDASKGWVETVEPGPEAVPGEHFIDRVGYHHGLYRRRALRDLGGYYGGFRIGYDSLLINLLLMTGKIVRVDEPLYHRRIRNASLVSAAETGFDSPQRNQTHRKLAHLYQQAFNQYRRCAPDERRGGELAARIRRLVARQIPSDEYGALVEATRRLQNVLHAERPHTPLNQKFPEESNMTPTEVQAPSENPEPLRNTESPHGVPPSAGSSLIPVSTAQHLIEATHPLGQATETATGNLGYGYLYYGLTRLEQPETVVCIGSYRGFSNICFALGLRDNGKGVCHFIDPGKVDDYWHHQDNIAELERRFDLQGHWRHLLKTSQQAVSENAVPEAIDILLIDGDHSYQGVKFDFDQLGARVRPGGLILLHDSTQRGRGFSPWEVPDFLKAEIYGKSQYETFTFPIASGLTLVRQPGSPPQPQHQAPAPEARRSVSPIRRPHVGRRRSRRRR